MSDVTRILAAIEQGDPHAAEQLLPLVYEERKTPWRLVKKYCRAAGIDPDGLGRRGLGVHSLRKTAINDAIRNGAQMHEVREFAGHSDIRTTELYFVRQEEDGAMAARRIQIRARERKDRPVALGPRLICF